MGAAIGQSLPVAVGVLLSPMPIVAVVLMLVSDRARSNGFAFLAGWLVGILVAGGVILLVVGAATPSDEGPAEWISVVKLVLGVLVLLLAVRQLRNRPHAGEEPPTPGWMAAIDTFTPPKAFGLAFLLSAVNPKNLLLIAAGAAAIAGATSVRADQLVALVVFALVASIGVATPIVIYLVLGERAAALLDRLKTWMVHNNAVIVSVLLLVIGAKMIGDGITGL